MKKRFFSFAGRRLAFGPRPKPAQRASEPARARQPTSRAGPRVTPRPSPAPFPCSRSPLAHAPTASGRSRCVATMRRCRSPRGSHGLTPLPCARLHLPKPVRSLAHSRAASSIRKHRAHSLCHSPRHHTRRRNPPRLLHLSQ